VNGRSALIVISDSPVTVAAIGGYDEKEPSK